MALSNSEYNLIMREYEERRYMSKHEQASRTAEVYEKIPRIREIQDEISSISVENMKNRLAGVKEGGNFTGEQLHRKINELIDEKKRLMEQYGYPEDYLKPKYICEYCQDTGYTGGEKCHCLKEKITELLYSRSNLKEVLKKENFSTFNILYYSEKAVDAKTGKNSRDNMLEILDKSKRFVERFDTEFENLFIYGETGVGKTFLTNCIAKELMDRSCSVIYMSAVHMFQVLEGEQFGKSSKNNQSGMKDLTSCDLLIIDDLGTELVNSFTISSLFNCLNERFLKKKSVIISTNLPIEEIGERYSERVFSRIASHYKVMKIFGADLRIITSLGLTNP
ncbi:MAG: ATP-binding protein [Lachnospiraceae bacterium]